MLYRSKKVLGMPVISLSDGRVVGRVKRLLLDLSNLIVAGIILDRKGLFKEQPVIPYSHVKNIGSHAVTVDASSAVVNLRSLPELEELAKKLLPLVGARVITEEGAVLGTVEDFYFDPRDGKILELELKGKLWQGHNLLPASAIRTCGRDALIVKAEAPVLLQRRRGAWNWPGLETAARATEKWSESLSQYLKRLPGLNRKDKPKGPTGDIPE
ncbi:MAG: PRC-barrel domain-containing protein [Thermanaeromonas sp.]|uniref:PRC-barrel domain-containing protein n=1 Tax=Thermanaeromonas sp. TaxID=2003697 RepID=UPI00243C7473|nr:PRC-barrel domain-containing protein [Thermanaeromonas sp.]MCG0277891.1 PRC-barrel domain-containing protein [Thermanaeromonas sp.]